MKPTQKEIKLANKIIKEMQDFGLTPYEMLKVIKLARWKFESMQSRKNPMKIIKDSIFINAGYRRKILDKWVFLQIGDKNDMLHLYKHILGGTKFVNADLQYWSDKLKSNK